MERERERNGVFFPGFLYGSSATEAFTVPSSPLRDGEFENLEVSYGPTLPSLSKL